MYDSLIRKIKSAAMYVVLVIYLIITGYPVIWMLISSLKNNTEYYSNPWGLPKIWVFSNFTEAWRRGVQNFLLNSLAFSVTTVITVIIIGSMFAFIVSRKPFRGASLMLSTFVVGMMIPIHSTLIPVFILEKNLGIKNTFLGLYFPYVAFSLPVAIFLLYGYFQQVPKELEEAAIIDGCSIYRIYASIFFPISKPILATVAILTTIGVWNEFVYALVLISKEYLKTLPVGLMSFKGMFSRDYGMMSAAIVIASFPIIILYVMMSDLVTKGMTAGAVKG